MSKSTLSTFQHSVLLRNAKVGERVQLTVREPIPRALDEKIKVASSLRAAR